MAKRKRQRTELAEENGDVRLSGELSTLMDGRRYCKQAELSRAVLLDCLKAKGEITEVQLLRVNVETLGGSSATLIIDNMSAGLTYCDLPI